MALYQCLLSNRHSSRKRMQGLQKEFNGDQKKIEIPLCAYMFTGQFHFDIRQVAGGDQRAHFIARTGAHENVGLATVGNQGHW